MGILNYIENEKIVFKSNNEFEFNINKNYKLSNIKINSSLEVKEIIYEVQNKKIQDIFDVDKYVRLINHKFKVNFNVDSTKNFKNSEIIIKGKGDLKSKNYKDTINYEYFKNDKKNNLIFNIDINDLFLFTPSFEIANYADDCTAYEFSGSIEDVINKLVQDSKILIEWYEMNYLKPNPDK